MYSLFLEDNYFQYFEFKKLLSRKCHKLHILSELATSKANALELSQNLKLLPHYRPGKHCREKSFCFLPAKAAE